MRTAVVVLSVFLLFALASVSGLNCDTPSAWNTNPTPQSGTSSWFNAVGQGGGACYYSPDTNDRYVAAISNPTAAQMCTHCGSCYNVTGPKGSVVVRIIDYCDTTKGTCTDGFFTLDQVPYTVIAGSTGTGSVPITYFPVACAWTRNLEYSYADGGNQKYYVAVRVLWHRYPLASFEIKQNGTTGPWTELPRKSNNNWWYNPLGAGQIMPAAVRVNDTAGQSITDTLPSFSFSSYTGTAQFAYLSGGTGTGSSGTVNNSGSPASTLVLPSFLISLCIVVFFAFFL